MAEWFKGPIRSSVISLSHYYSYNFLLPYETHYCKHFLELMTAAETAIQEKTIMDRPRTDPDRPQSGLFSIFFAAGQIKNKPVDWSNAPVIDRSTKRSAVAGPNFMYPKSLVMTQILWCSS